MSVTAEQRRVATLLGINNIDSQNDINQINRALAGSKAAGVNRIDSANDIRMIESYYSKNPSSQDYFSEVYKFKISRNNFIKIYEIKILYLIYLSKYTIFCITRNLILYKIMKLFEKQMLYLNSGVSRIFTHIIHTTGLYTAEACPGLCPTTGHASD